MSMKIPYIKIYTADLLAKSRKLTAEQIGSALIGICEQAFENYTDYIAKTESEEAFYEMLMCWKNESVFSLKQKKKAGRLGAKKTNEKRRLSDGGTAVLSADGIPKRHTETETDTETEIKEIQKKADSVEKQSAIEIAFDQFWTVFPKQRIGNKDKARSAFIAAVKRTGTSAEQIIEKSKDYARSNEVARGYAKGAAAWLNDDRFLIDYADLDAKRVQHFNKGNALPSPLEKYEA